MLILSFRSRKTGASRTIYCGTAIGQCGFGSINHAKAVFKKRFSMTMREWRTRHS